MTTIGLLGATGYTGRLVAAELARRHLPARLGGRDPDRLGAIAPTTTAEHFVVDVGDPDRLALFFEGLDAVISCVGPFTRHGDPVVDAAVSARVPYVDSTGETAFMEAVYDRHADAPVPVVPACGFEYVPGDLGAALAAEAAGGEVTDVVVGYLLRGARPSRGTARTAITTMDQVRFYPRRITLDFPDGPRHGFTVPWGEEVTVPRFLPGAQVRTGIVTRTSIAYALSLAAPGFLVTAPLRRLARPVLERLVERIPEAPHEWPGEHATPEEASIRIGVWARGANGAGAVSLVVGDPYALTAATLVEAAVQVAAEGCPTGALTTAQAFDPAGFLDAVSGPHLAWERF